MSEKRLKPRTSSVIKVYIPVMLIVLLALYGLFSSRFAWAYKDDGLRNEYIARDLIVVGAWFVAFIILLIVLIKRNYYVITKTGIIHYQFISSITYDFNNVIFIDEKYTLKHKTLLFDNNKGKALYLVLDKNMELLDIFKKNCHNLKEYVEINKK